MSEHADVREALELAAVEPGGLDRLEAGDTPAAIAVAAHLAGCPDCLEELARLRRADSILRPILASTPDPELRDRTLAFVRAVGVRREAPVEPRGAIESPPAQAPLHRRVPTPAWVGAIAAALVVGLVGGSLLAGAGKPAGNGDPVTVLASLARQASTIMAAGDVREVVLRDPAGTPSGSMLISPAAGRILVTASDLAPASAGREYRCWVEVGNARTAIGTMWRAGSVEWWGGDVAVPADLPAGLVYGVSLVDEGSSGPGTVVLTGEL